MNVFHYYLINMHLSINWLLQHSCLYLNPTGWKLVGVLSSSRRSHHSSSRQCVSIFLWYNNRGLDVRFNENSHPLVQFQLILVIPHCEILGLKLVLLCTPDVCAILCGYCFFIVRKHILLSPIMGMPRYHWYSYHHIGGSFVLGLRVSLIWPGIPQNHRCFSLRSHRIS